MNYPRGIAFDPVNRRVWVANNAGGTIYVYDDQALPVPARQRRQPPNSVPGIFQWPFAIAFCNG